MKKLTIEVDDKLHLKIKQEAKKNGYRLSFYLKTILEKHFKGVKIGNSNK
ncbi:MAG: hypothetical protein L6Q54_11750 [Leptospiraceae bacterium]|nr:hypothetical protein [Leptospiraceae bacterium]